MLPDAWCPGCYLLLETEAKELPSPQVAEVLVSGAKAPALILRALLELTAVTGTDSGRLWTFWHCFSVICVLCSVVWLQIATGLPSRQEKSPESRGVVGKQVLLHVIKEEVENYF